MKELAIDDAISGVIVQPHKSDVEAWEQTLNQEYEALVRDPMRVVVEAFKVLDVDPETTTPAQMNVRTQQAYALDRLANTALKIKQYEDKKAR